MLTPDEMDALSRELNKPYSDAELSRHLTDRALKSVCEKMHTHNLALISCVNDWRDHLQGDAPEPETKIWKALRPGHNPENEACTTLEELIEIAANYGSGKVPLLPILIFVSRSTATLIERLDALHHTPHIDTMDATAKEAFALLARGGGKRISAANFAAELHRLKDEFVKVCAANAAELHSYVFGLKEKNREASAGEAGMPPLRRCGILPHQTDNETTASAVEKAQAKIVKVVAEEAKKTRRTVKATAKKAVKEIRTNAQSEYDKRGPSSTVRAYQLRAVIDRMAEYKANPKKLPATLRDKSPSKWMHQACRDTWVKKDGGYPSMNSLYLYCHRNEERIMSLAGI